MAVPSYDTSSSSTGGGGWSVSQAHTIAAQDQNRILIVWFFAMAGSNAATKFTDVQYNGTAPTGQITPDIEHDRFTNFGSVIGYYWVDDDLPTNGTPTSYNVTATANGSQWNGHCAAISLTGAEQSAPDVEARGENEDNTSSSLGITTLTADSMLIDTVAIVTSDSSAGLSATAGQTEVQDFGATSSYRFGVAYEAAASTGLYTQTWSWVNSTTFDMEFILAIAPAEAAAGISFVDSDTSTATGPSLTLDVPTGTQDGDLLIAAVIITDDAPDVSWDTVPSGWTLYVDDQATGGAPSSPPKLYIWYRIADSEPASYTWTGDDIDAGYMGAMLGYRGVDNSTPFDATRTIATGTGTSLNPASITTVTADAWVVAVGFSDDNDGYSGLSSGYTARVASLAFDPGASGNGATLGICDIDAGATGAEDPPAWTIASEEWGAVTLALRPDQGAPPAVEFHPLLWCNT